MKLKLGFDVHGVLDSKPEFFAVFTALLVDNGHEVHVLTGAELAKEKARLDALGVKWTHFFSIADAHADLVTRDAEGNPWLDPYVWDKAKAAYCLEHGIHLHLDDSDIYSYFFKTPYARFFSKDSQRVAKVKVVTACVQDKSSKPS